MEEHNIDEDIFEIAEIDENDPLVLDTDIIDLTSNRCEQTQDADKADTEITDLYDGSVSSVRDANTFSFSGDEGRDFIWMVRDKPIVWDSRSYKNVTMAEKNKVWSDIGRAYGLTCHETFENFTKLKLKYAAKRDSPTMDDMLIELSFLDPILDYEMELRKMEESQTEIGKKVSTQRPVEEQLKHQNNKQTSDVKQFLHLKDLKSVVLPSGVLLKRIQRKNDIIESVKSIKNDISLTLKQRNPRTTEGEQKLLQLIESNRYIWEGHSLAHFPYISDHWVRLSNHFNCGARKLYIMFIEILRKRQKNPNAVTDFVNEILAKTEKMPVGSQFQNGKLQYIQCPMIKRPIERLNVNQSSGGNIVVNRPLTSNINIAHTRKVNRAANKAMARHIALQLMLMRRPQGDAICHKTLRMLNRA